ncbi:leucine-rich repeat-containing G-protein coupled receptor 6-like isoform X1 [Carcharodon carcharias]|uniref:leucine-rich repeat-containing G-protein coupled receptor 6-like isoform X1 n=1 Tax=Carcharodon carcharias TaxID=13397 RepID=UPI001B7F0020|nr:leucine-rich repeat-containing G-protein coupled receptor 6-like isoform X1 [Carcharodon carcharias]
MPGTHISAVVLTVVLKIFALQTQALLAPMRTAVQFLIILLGTGVTAACPEKCFCYSTLVDCRHIALQNIPPDVSPGTETLFLDGNSLVRIPRNAFGNLGNMSYLGLSSNRLLLRNYTFEPLLKLQALDLSANHLLQLQETLLENLSNLTWLNLASNNLQRFPPMMSLAKLTYLDLSNNELIVFQETFKHLPQLDTVFLNNNQLKALPATGFDQLFLLKVLDLSNNDLSSLPSRFFNKHRKLTDLRLDHNKLRNLTATLFSHLDDLQYLTISGNAPVNFPPELFSNLTKLLKLDLSSNSLTFLPKNFLSNLQQLQVLKLSDNFIGNLVADIFKCNPKLVYLHLDSNNLRTLPVFEGLQQLEELTLSFNRLVEFPKEFGDNLVKLQCLQVNDNLIRQWDSEGFQNVSSVILSNNPICLNRGHAARVESTNIECTKKHC